MIQGECPSLLQRLASIILLAAFVSGAAMAQTEAAPPKPSEAAARPGEEIELARALLEQWVEQRRLISKERRDWQVDRALLQDRIALLERQIAELDESIATERKRVSDAREAYEKAEGELAVFDRAFAELATRLPAVEARARALFARLPEALRSRQDLARQANEIPSEAPKADAEQDLQRRLARVVIVVNETSKFDQSVSVIPETIVIEGQAKEVDVLHVGLGGAWYVTADLKQAAIGKATDEGWMWVPVHPYAQDIARAIAIAKGKSPAGYVRLPMAPR